MKKVALLTRTVLWTRVIATVPDSWDENRKGEVTDDVIESDFIDKVEADMTAQLIDKLNIEGVRENIDGIWNDTECPYDEIDFVELTRDEKLARLIEAEFVEFEESTYDTDDDRPMAYNGYILGVEFAPDGKIRFGIDVDGCLFTVEDEDIDDRTREFVIDEAYAYRFGEGYDECEDEDEDGDE